MALVTEFTEIQLADIPEMSKTMKRDGARFVQVLAVKNTVGVDLVYSFMLDNALKNFRVNMVTAEDKVPSITDRFLAAFVFENEAHDLFGVTFTDLAIDFGGKFYSLSENTPMLNVKTVAAPKPAAPKAEAGEKKAMTEEERAAKIAAAKAAKAAREAAKAKETEAQKEATNE